jgi:DnaJ-class molecular chaperone
VPDKMCSDCSGIGQKKASDSIQIDQPVKYGHQYVFKEKGHLDVSSDIPRGNLVVNVKPQIPECEFDSFYNVKKNVTVDALNFMVSNDVVVNGLNNEKITLNLKNNLYEYSFPGKGIPNNGARTNLIITVSPTINNIENKEFKEKVVEYLSEVNK